MNTTNTNNNYGPFTVLISWLIALFLIGEAIATAVVVPGYEQLFSNIGTDLPLLTKAILLGPMLIWVLPASALVLIIHGSKNRESQVGPLLFIFVLVVLWVPTAAYGLYLPIWDLSETNLQ